MLTKRFDKSVVDGLLRRVILETEDVVSITSFESSFNPSLRTYKTTYSVEITASDSDGAINRTDNPYTSGNIIDNLTNSIVLSGGNNLVYRTIDPNFKC